MVSIEHRSLRTYFYFIRKKSEKEYEDKLDSVQEKLAVATATLQQSIGSITNQVASQVEKVKISIFKKDITDGITFWQR